MVTPFREMSSSSRPVHPSKSSSSSSSSQSLQFAWIGSMVNMPLSASTIARSPPSRRLLSASTSRRNALQLGSDWLRMIPAWRASLHDESSSDVSDEEKSADMEISDVMLSGEQLRYNKEREKRREIGKLRQIIRPITTWWSRAPIMRTFSWRSASSGRCSAPGARSRAKRACPRARSSS